MLMSDALPIAALVFGVEGVYGRKALLECNSPTGAVTPHRTRSRCGLGCNRRVSDGIPQTAPRARRRRTGRPFRCRSRHAIHAPTSPLDEAVTRCMRPSVPFQPVSAVLIKPVQESNGALWYSAGPHVRYLRPDPGAVGGLRDQITCECSSQGIREALHSLWLTRA